MGAVVDGVRAIKRLWLARKMARIAKILKLPKKSIRYEGFHVEGHDLGKGLEKHVVRSPDGIALAVSQPVNYDQTDGSIDLLYMESFESSVTGPVKYYRVDYQPANDSGDWEHALAQAYGANIDKSQFLPEKVEYFYTLIPDLSFPARAPRPALHMVSNETVHFSVTSNITDSSAYFESDLGLFQSNNQQAKSYGVYQYFIDPSSSHDTSTNGAAQHTYILRDLNGRVLPSTVSFLHTYESIVDRFAYKWSNAYSSGTFYTAANITYRNKIIPVSMYLLFQDAPEWLQPVTTPGGFSGAKPYPCSLGHYAFNNAYDDSPVAFFVIETQSNLASETTEDEAEWAILFSFLFLAFTSSGDHVPFTSTTNLGNSASQLDIVMARNGESIYFGGDPVNGINVPAALILISQFFPCNVHAYWAGAYPDAWAFHSESNVVYGWSRVYGAVAFHPLAGLVATTLIIPSAASSPGVQPRITYGMNGFYFCDCHRVAAENFGETPDLCSVGIYFGSPFSYWIPLPMPEGKLWYVRPSFVSEQLAKAFGVIEQTGEFFIGMLTYSLETTEGNGWRIIGKLPLTISDPNLTEWGMTLFGNNGDALNMWRYSTIPFASDQIPQFRDNDRTLD